MTPRILALSFLVAASPVFADSHDPFAASGDPEAGAAAFARQCVACHVVVDDAGEKLAGKNGKTGPNLYAIAGRPAAKVEGYKYGKSMVKAGSDEFGLIWDEEKFTTYMKDPTKFLRTFLDDSKARAKMTTKVRKDEDALNLYAFLHSLAPPPLPEGEAATTN